MGALDRPGGEVAIPTGASAAGAKAPPAGEPTLDQLLAEPIVQQLMRRDRTNPASIRQLLRGTAAARITGRPKCPTARSDHPPLAAPAVSCLPPHIAHRFPKLVAILSTVFPVFLCAWLADRSGRRDLFERAGSITTTIGLVFASATSDML